MRLLPTAIKKKEGGIITIERKKRKMQLTLLADDVISLKNQIQSMKNLSGDLSTESFR